MKKSLLLSFCLFFYAVTQAQVFYAVSPASVQGNYPFSWAFPSGGWGTPDLVIPANAIQDTLMLVDDGTAGDTLSCNPLINNLAGKIAVIYRGSCEFGVKALNAQNAGAVGVVIINNAPGTLQMGPGAQGANVTIPTTMISNDDGAKLRAQMDLGNSVVVFIGNKNGLYANDLGFYKIDVVGSRATAIPKLIAQNASEFSIEMGTWAHNYGSANQTGVFLTANITGAATYSASSASTPVSLNVGDSAYIAVGTYSASSYSGLYEINYTLSNGTADGFPGDNTFYSNVLVDSLFSYALVDKTLGIPKSSAHYATNPMPVDEKSCIHFRDANASRMAAMGLWFSAFPPNGGDLTGEDILTQMYEWNDVFTGFSDPNFPPAPWTLNLVGQAQYQYASNNDRGKMIYVPFPTPVVLVDNQRYLFCIHHNTTAQNQNVVLGYDIHFDYKNLVDSTDQPISVAIVDAAHYGLGYGTDATSSVTPKFGPKDVSVKENSNAIEVTPFPNPTTDYIKIPLKGMNGSASLDIMDMSGKVVSSQKVKVGSTVSVDVKGIPNGTYAFSMIFDNGKTAKFNVVIAR